MFLVIVSLYVVTGPMLVDNQVNENTDLFTQPLFPQGWHLGVPLQPGQLETLTSGLHCWWWPFELVLTDSWKIICVLRAKETQTFSRLWPHNQKFQKRSGIYGLASTLSGICCLLWEQFTFCSFHPPSAAQHRWGRWWLFRCLLWDELWRHLWTRNSYAQNLAGSSERGDFLSDHRLRRPSRPKCCSPREWVWPPAAAYPSSGLLWI